MRNVSSHALRSLFNFKAGSVLALCALVFLSGACKGVIRSAPKKVTIVSSGADQVAPTLTYIAPADLAALTGGGTANITWSAADAGFGATPISIEVSADGGATWNAVAGPIANTGSYSWSVPSVTSKLYQLRVIATDSSGNSTTDGNTANFWINSTTPVVTVTAPNGGEYFKDAQSTSITWTTAGLPAGPATAKVEYSLNNGSSWTTVNASNANTLSEAWTTPATDSDSALIRVTVTDSFDVQTVDVSNAVFVIDQTEPALALDSLVGGQIVAGGVVVPIQWTATDIHMAAAPISIEVSSNSGGSWTALAGPLANSGSYNWTTPVVTSTTYRVRVIAVDRSTNSTTVTSSSDFTINSSSPVITVTSPSGGQYWQGGSVHNITWTTSGLPIGGPGTIKLEYTLDGTNYTQIATGETDDGTYSWTVPAATDVSTAKIRATVTDFLANDTVDVSDTNFTIDSTLPSLTLTQPNGGEVIAGGASYSITWNTADTNLGTTPIAIEVSSNSGVGWSSVATNVAHSGNPGTYSWTVPSVDSTTYRIRLTTTDLAGHQQVVSSASDFEIVSTAPALASLTITNSSYTNNTTLGLTFGAVSGGTANQYCLQLNDSAVANCSWQSYGSFPASIAGGSDGTKIAYAWMKGPTGLESSMVTSNSVTLDTVLPTLTTVTIHNVSPTSSRGYLLSYSGPSETISAYCINENDTAVGNCGWVTASALPDNFTVSATQNAKVLTIWVRDLAGNQQLTGRNSNSVTYSNVLAISPTSSTLSQAYSTEIIEGQSGNHVSVLMSNGNILVAGGCSIAWSPTPVSRAKVYDVTNDVWINAGHMRHPRCQAAWTSLADGRVLVAGGLTAVGVSTATAEIYDPVTNKWTVVSPMGTARSNATATLLASGKVLIAGGYTNSESSGNTRDSTEIFDPTTKIWLTGPSMASKRQNHRAVRLTGGNVLLIGGSISSTNSTTTTSIFTPSGHTGTMAAGPTLNLKRSDFAVMLLSAAESPTAAEAVMVFGGYDGNTTYTNTAELYDGTSWTTKTAITGARRGHSATKMSDGRIIINGGHDGTNTLNTTGRYDPKAASGAGSWTSRAASPANYFHSPAIMLSNGKIFQIMSDGHWGDMYLGLVTLYTPGTNTWDNSSKAIMFPIVDFSLAHMPFANGKVLMCGVRDTETPECFMFNQTKASVDPVKEMSNYRAAPAMVELADGRAIAVGGAYGGLSSRYNNAEIYDPATNLWSTTANMSSYFNFAKGAALSGNRIMVVGGAGGSAFNHNSAQIKTHIYDVAAGTWSNPGSADLTTGVMYHQLVVTPAGRIFVAGGWTGSASTNKVYEWNNGTTSWTAKANMATARNTFALSYMPGGTDGKLIAIGGYTGNYTGVLGSVEIYDIGTDAWSAGPAIPGSHTQAGLCAQYLSSTNEVMFVGNFTGTDIHRVVYRYSVSGGSWSTSFSTISNIGNDSNLGVNMCGVLPDGRFWKGAAGDERGIFEVINMATPVKYTATKGDGDYNYSITLGTGILDARNYFIPAIPLVPASSSTIRVTDGTAQTADATASVP